MSEKIEQYVAYVDGGCWPNDGTGDGGWGAVIYGRVDGKIKELHQICGGEKLVTNNKMELQAAIEAVYWLRDAVASRGADLPEITIMSDSQYVVNGMVSWVYKWMSQGWCLNRSQTKKVKNEEQWRELFDMADGLKVKWVWVRGHSGIMGNEIADNLAEKGAKLLKENGVASLGAIERLPYNSICQMTPPTPQQVSMF